MGVIVKYCSVCQADTKHNESGAKGVPRCVMCANPPGTGPKAERNKVLGAMAAKARALSTK